MSTPFTTIALLYHPLLPESQRLAADMLERAMKAMVPPFVVSVFADPSGSYTTAASSQFPAGR